MATAVSRHLPIIPTMTVNHVLKVHPNARPILEAFHVHCETDGLDCLDELEWYRGIDVAALLEVLNGG